MINCTLAPLIRKIDGAKVPSIDGANFNYLIESGLYFSPKAWWRFAAERIVVDAHRGRSYRTSTREFILARLTRFNAYCRAYRRSLERLVPAGMLPESAAPKMSGDNDAAASVVVGTAAASSRRGTPEPDRHQQQRAQQSQQHDVAFMRQMEHDPELSYEVRSDE